MPYTNILQLNIEKPIDKNFLQSYNIGVNKNNGNTPITERTSNMKNEQKAKHPTLESMDTKISNFISENWGTDAGERIYRSRCNIRDDDFDGIQKIYNEVLAIA